MEFSILFLIELGVELELGNNGIQNYWVAQKWNGM